MLLKKLVQLLFSISLWLLYLNLPGMFPFQTEASNQHTEASEPDLPAGSQMEERDRDHTGLRRAPGPTRPQET